MITYFILTSLTSPLLGNGPVKATYCLAMRSSKVQITQNPTCIPIHDLFLQAAGKTSSTDFYLEGYFYLSASLAGLGKTPAQMQADLWDKYQAGTLQFFFLGNAQPNFDPTPAGWKATPTDVTLKVLSVADVPWSGTEGARVSFLLKVPSDANHSTLAVSLKGTNIDTDGGSLGGITERSLVAGTFPPDIRSSLITDTIVPISLMRPWDASLQTTKDHDVFAYKPSALSTPVTYEGTVDSLLGSAGGWAHISHGAPNHAAFKHRSRLSITTAKPFIMIVDSFRTTTPMSKSWEWSAVIRAQ